MAEITSDYTTGLIKITEQYDISASQSAIYATPYLTEIGQEYIVSFIDLQNVIQFTEFHYLTLDALETRHLDTYYQVSFNNLDWTNWLWLDEYITNFPPMDPLSPMFLNIKFVRSGTKVEGNVRIVQFELIGQLLINQTNNDFVTVGPGTEVVVYPPYVYKVFKLWNVEIISSTFSEVSFSYKYSQDNGRSWSGWEPLTKENITTVRINPVRFFQVQYLIQNNSNNSISVQDINLWGDFQNVTNDYQKTNLFGVRDCCQTNLAYDSNGNPITPTTGNLDGGGPCATGYTFNPLTPAQVAQLYNPYAQAQALALLNSLSNNAVEIFGHNITYFVTDPDGNGIDYTLHEFQLYNINCSADLKATVDNNQFPDNQIKMNMFDLTLFDSFEIQITKETFKSLFGVQRRPSKEDRVYFCDLNRLFIVDHAQQFRNFNNYAIYYRIMLKKYNEAANVIPGSKIIENSINQLTNNTTVNQLFGIENELDKKSTANLKQLETLTRDPIRYEYKANIVKAIIENSTTIISKSQYDFSNLLYNGYQLATQSVAGVIYKNIDTILKVSDNIGFFLWFNINNYTINDTYNFFNFYDPTESLGWSVNLIADNIYVDINSSTFTFSFAGTTQSAYAITEGTWYCYVLNVDQRQGTICQYIYERNNEFEDFNFLTSTDLCLVYSNKQTMIPQFFQFEDPYATFLSSTFSCEACGLDQPGPTFSRIDAEILASDIQMTNIRLFNDIIPESEHNKILNEIIIGLDSKYLVFADNANTKITTLPWYPYNSSKSNSPV